jgi:hypothetical protein
MSITSWWGIPTCARESEEAEKAHTCPFPKGASSLARRADRRGHIGPDTPSLDPFGVGVAIGPDRSHGDSQEPPCDAQDWLCNMQDVCRPAQWCSPYGSRGQGYCQDCVLLTRRADACSQGQRLESDQGVRTRSDAPAPRTARDVGVLVGVLEGVDVGGGTLTPCRRPRMGRAYGLRRGRPVVGSSRRRRMTGRARSSMSSNDPALRSNEISLMRAPASQVSSMKRRIDVWSVSAWLT